VAVAIEAERDTVGENLVAGRIDSRRCFRLRLEVSGEDLGVASS